MDDERRGTVVAGNVGNEPPVLGNRGMIGVAGTVVPGGSTLAEPSSAELAELTATVQETGVPAIFANTADPRALVAALASEVGDVAVVDLYVGSLGAPGSEAGTYQQMMTTNAQRISEALAG